MTKLIGITSNITEHKTTLNTAYINAFTRPGVTPVIMPIFPVKNRETMTAEKFAEEFKDNIAAYVKGLDALCVSGGVDVNPLSVNEMNYASNGCDTIRDFMELALIDAFVKEGKPIIGICRGLQIIGLYLQLENFFQDLGDTGETHDGGSFGLTKRQEAPHYVWPRGTYRTYLEEKSGREDVSILSVNSWHHQGFCLIDTPKLPKFKDGGVFWQWLNNSVAKYEATNKVKILSTTRIVIEGFEDPVKKIVAHQHHPEEFGPESLAIGYFVDNYLK